MKRFGFSRYIGKRSRTGMQQRPPIHSIQISISDVGERCIPALTGDECVVVQKYAFIHLGWLRKERVCLLWLANANCFFLLYSYCLLPLALVTCLLCLLLLPSFRYMREDD